MNWALDHSGVIIGVSVVDVPDDVPAEPDGRPRRSCPTRTWASGRSTSTRPKARRSRAPARSRFKLLKELEGHRGRRADRAVDRRDRPGAGASTHIHFLCLALPIDERKDTQAQMIARDAQAARGASRPTGRASRRATRWAAARAPAAIAISANILGPGPRSAGRLLAEGARRGAEDCRASAEPKISLSVSNPEIHVAVDRQRAADLGVRMATIGNTLRLAVAGDDQISNFREGAGAVPGQDPRAREPAARHRARSAG